MERRTTFQSWTGPKKANGLSKLHSGRNPMKTKSILYTEKKELTKKMKMTRRANDQMANNTNTYITFSELRLCIFFTLLFHFFLYIIWNIAYFFSHFTQHFASFQKKKKKCWAKIFVLGGQCDGFATQQKKKTKIPFRQTTQSIFIALQIYSAKCNRTAQQTSNIWFISVLFFCLSLFSFSQLSFCPWPFCLDGNVVISWELNFSGAFCVHNYKVIMRL